jgi:hypothetical protein
MGPCVDAVEDVKRKMPSLLSNKWESPVYVHISFITRNHKSEDRTISAPLHLPPTPFPFTKTQKISKTPPFRFSLIVRLCPLHQKRVFAVLYDDNWGFRRYCSFRRDRWLGERGKIACGRRPRRRSSTGAGLWIGGARLLPKPPFVE